MEYCEKSTLRDTIDHGLHQDRTRLWRLFREILDGLAYIHQQVREKMKDEKMKVISLLTVSLNSLLSLRG